MFKLFFQEGEGDDPQKNLIAEAANRLDVGEFQLFQLGYEAWYGHTPEPDRIEPHFYSYMVNDDPPASDTFLSLPCVKKPTQFPSGDKKALLAPSVSVIGDTSS